MGRSIDRPTNFPKKYVGGIADPTSKASAQGRVYAVISCHIAGEIVKRVPAMDTKYFYTLGLGKAYGEKLETLAAFASYEDVEAFATMLLRGAIDQMHKDMAADLDTAGKEAGAASGPASPGGTDDDLPF